MRTTRERLKQKMWEQKVGAEIREVCIWHMNKVSFFFYTAGRNG